MNRVQYLFLDFQDTRVNYSFMLENNACKEEESRVNYLHLEYSEGGK